MAAALSDYIIHLPSTHFQTRWLDIVGSLLEDEGRRVRLLEGPFVALAQIRPLPSGHNIVMNVVHDIEISPSHSCEGACLDRCSLLRKYQFRVTFIKTSGPFLSHYTKGHSRPEEPG